MQDFFRNCGVLGVNHVAVTTPDLPQTLDAYVNLPGASLKKKPGWNDIQKVEYAFVEVSEGFNIEILSARGNSSPIERHIKNGGGAYHFCFDVKNMVQALSAAALFGAIQITEAKEDPAFSGKRVCFLYHQAFGVFEFVET